MAEKQRGTKRLSALSECVQVCGFGFFHATSELCVLSRTQDDAFNTKEKHTWPE